MSNFKVNTDQEALILRQALYHYTKMIEENQRDYGMSNRGHLSDIQSLYQRALSLSVTGDQS